MATAFGDTCNHLARLLDVELAAGEVVQEKQRFGPLDNEIVHRHGDEIDADRVVLSRIDGHLELGPDPVTGCHQNGITETACREIEQAAESPQHGITPGTPGRAR